MDGELRMTPHHTLPESTVFVAFEGDQIVGTITATADSAAGLPLDASYGDALDELRGRGERLVEFGSLAVVRRCYHSGVVQLLNTAAYEWSRKVLEATKLVAGVHPKVIPWYRAIYNFGVIGEPKKHDRLEAPVVGMASDVAELPQHLTHIFTRPLASGLTLTEHLKHGLPECFVGIDASQRPTTARAKMSRTIFQELFIERSDLIKHLDQRTAAHLRSHRSENTLNSVSLPSIVH
jgi:hypothetical protein